MLRSRACFLGLSVVFAIAIALAACHDSDPSATLAVTPTGADAGAACPLLFGRPNEKTGLGSDMCAPRCGCGTSSFAPPDYDETFIRALVTDYQHVPPYAPLTSDPYAQPAPQTAPPATVCAVQWTGDAGAVPRPYELVSYPTEAMARAEGAVPTHFGSCGVCSTLENLAVYMRENDLTTPVRACGISEGDAVVACLQKLGFDLPCAQIWAYNVANTRAQCLDVCFANLSKPYHLPSGELNPCLLCDEAQSGAVFKAVAGRTRRNSGLPNAMCRPCTEVQPLVHAY